MSYRTIRHSHPVKGGMILSGVTQPLGTDKGGAMDHTHPNLEFLNTLNMDSESRLRTNLEIINPPLEEKEW